MPVENSVCVCVCVHVHASARGNMQLIYVNLDATMQKLLVQIGKPHFLIKFKYGLQKWELLELNAKVVTKSSP